VCQDHRLRLLLSPGALERAPVRLQETPHSRQHAHINTTHTLPAACSGGNRTWTVSIHPLTFDSSSRRAANLRLPACGRARASPSLPSPPRVETSRSMSPTHVTAVYRVLVAIQVLYHLFESLAASPGAHRSTARLPSNAHQPSTSGIIPPLPKSLQTFPAALCLF
jgi:hypothetical protein